MEDFLNEICNVNFNGEVLKENSDKQQNCCIVKKLCHECENAIYIYMSDIRVQLRRSFCRIRRFDYNFEAIFKDGE